MNGDDLRHYLLLSPTVAVTVVLTTAVMYVVFTGLLRGFGQRLFAHPASISWAAAAVVAAIVGRTSLGLDPTLLGGLLALATLLVMERLAAVWWPRPHPALPLVVAGVRQEAELRQLRFADEALWSTLREKGIGSLADVALATLEPNGRISVVRSGSPLDAAVLAGVRPNDATAALVTRERG
jgi:uncharacterized membrane protein YcaP (DUF421 family)